MGWVVGGAMWVWAGLWVEAWLWVGGGVWGGGVARHLLAQQVVVHLQALRLLEGLLQALVALPQLPHVIARLR